MMRYNIFMKTEILKYTEQVLKETPLEISEIPQIPLYMDQIVSLMANQKRDSEDKILTKTMIHNYSKAKIIKPIKGKTYPREQIIQLLMVYVLKNMLTMEELKQVMLQMYDTSQLGEQGFERCYQRFLDFEKSKVNDADELMKKLVPDDKSKTPYEDALVSLLTITSLANQLQKVAEKIVEVYYPKKIKKEKNKGEKK